VHLKFPMTEPVLITFVVEHQVFTTRQRPVVTLSPCSLANVQQYTYSRIDLCTIERFETKNRGLF
jgi:hypothetical protein